MLLTLVVCLKEKYMVAFLTLAFVVWCLIIPSDIIVRISAIFLICLSLLLVAFPLL